MYASNNPASLAKIAEGVKKARADRYARSKISNFCLTVSF